MTVAHTDDSGVFKSRYTGIDFEQAKVAGAVMGESVGLSGDGKTLFEQGDLDNLQKLDVRDGPPRAGGSGRFGLGKFAPADGMATVVQEQVAALGRGR
jgi:hypothetical protein